MAICRLCLESVDVSQPDPGLLADVCACRGTQRYVHALCLEQWQLACIERNEWYLARHCSVCRARFACGLPWGALWSQGVAAAKGPWAGSTLRIAATPLPFWALLALFLPLWDALGTSLLVLLCFVAGQYFVNPQGLEATLTSVVVFALSWVWLLWLPYILRRLQRPSALWAAVLASAELPTEPFGPRVWWGEVADGGLLRRPAVRSTGSSMVLVNTSLLLLYGGWTSDEGPCNELWAADWQNVRATQRLDWILVSVGNPHLRPSETYGQSFTLLGDDRALVFGGHTKGGYRAPSSQWRVLAFGQGGHSASWTAGGDAPLGVSWHSATLVGPGRSPRLRGGFVLVFGGSGAFGASGSVLLLDLSALGRDGSEAWHLDPPYVRGRAPPPRTAHSATLVGGDRLLIMGGTDGEPMPWQGEDLDDGIWEFDVASLAWRGHHTVPGLHAPRQHTAAFALGALVVFGGGTGGSSVVQVVTEAGGAEQGAFAVHSPAGAPLRGTMNLTITGRTDAVPTAMEVASAEAPTLRGHCALWTGSEMVVFGGSTSESLWGEYSGMLVMRPV